MKATKARLGRISLASGNIPRRRRSKVRMKFIIGPSYERRIKRGKTNRVDDGTDSCTCYSVFEEYLQSWRNCIPVQQQQPKQKQRKKTRAMQVTLRTSHRKQSELLEVRRKESETPNRTNVSPKNCPYVVFFLFMIDSPLRNLPIE